MILNNTRFECPAFGVPFMLGPKQTGTFFMKKNAPTTYYSGEIHAVATDGLDRKELVVAQGDYLIYSPTGSNLTTSAIVTNGGMPF